MNLSVGIVGLPNAGKSTLFNALLKKQVAFVANFPFATIEPNVGVVPVPDPRLAKIAEVISGELSVSKREEKKIPVVPATVRFIDIAGLVAGAHKGEGLGNKFLAHIREVDLICHVLRDFADVNVAHVAGEVDEKRDREIIETELMMADLQTLENQKSKINPFDKLRTRNQNDNSKLKNNTVEKLKAELNTGKPSRLVTLNNQEKEVVRDLHLLTMKPVLYIKNVGEGELINYSSSEPQANREVYLKNEVLDAATLRSNNNNVVVISAKIEAELASLSEDEQKEYLKSLSLEKSGLERLIQKAYQMLGLISFLTGGEKEVRAWTIKGGTKAPQAAGVIHTDFERNFIKAEVMDFPVFVECGGWTKARDLGKIRLEGRDYVMRDGDVVDFKIGS